MSDLKSQLIRLGYSSPALRPHLRKIIATLESRTAASEPREIREMKRYAIEQGIPEKRIQINHIPERRFQLSDSKTVKRMFDGNMRGETWRFFIRTPSSRKHHITAYFYPEVKKWTGEVGPTGGERANSPKFIKKYIDEFAAIMK